MEVVLNSLDSYDSTVVKACNALGMKFRNRDCAHTTIKLLRMSGAVIPDKEINGQSWTIGRYVEHAFSNRSHPNIGVHVATLEEVHSIHLVVLFCVPILWEGLLSLSVIANSKMHP